MHYSYLGFAEGKSANRCRSIKDLADIFEIEATTAVLWPFGIRRDRYIPLWLLGLLSCLTNKMDVCKNG